MIYVLQEGRFMRIGLDLLDSLDETKTYEIQLALTLLYLVKPRYVWYGDSYIKTSPSLLIKQFGNYEKINQRQQLNVVETLVDLKERGLIIFEREIKFKEEILINVKPLLILAESENFVKIKIKDFFTLMESETPLILRGKEKTINGIETLSLLTLIYINATFNNESLEYLKEFDTGEVARDITTDRKLQNLNYVFCNATLEQIRTHKHPSLENVSNWIDEDYLSAIINRLETLGIIKIVKKKVTCEKGMKRNMNFYYSPEIDSDNMEVIINQYVRRMGYVIKSEYSN